jgi:spore germination protein YaaH
VRVRTFAIAVSATAVMAATIAGSAAQAGASTSAPAPRRIVSGWMPYWSTTSSTADVVANAGLFSDASPFWFTAASAGVISSHVPASTVSSVVSQLHALSVPVIPTVTDGTGAHHMAAILESAAARAEHVNALVALVTNDQLDGIDLDYEDFAFSDGQSTWATTRVAWDAFIAQLGAALHARGKLLSVDVPYMTGPTTGYWVYDYAGIGRSVDRLRIMTYDWSVSHPGPIAPISWVSQVAAFAATQLPSSKVFIGVAAYGRDWPLSTAGCPVDNMPGTASYTTTQAEALAASLHVTPAWNPTYAERTFSYRQTYRGHSASGGTAACTITRLVWFDDASAAAARVALVGADKLGGIAIWALGGEAPATWGFLRTYAAGIAPVATSVSAAVSPATVAYPSHALVTGVVRRADGTALSGVTLQFQYRAVGGSTWTTSTTATSSVTGAVSATVWPPTEDMQYRWVVPSSYSLIGSASLPATLAVSIPSGAVYTTSGYHTVSGRQWHTTCAPYGAVSTRCWAYLFATSTSRTSTGYVTTDAWVLNNLTYTGPSPSWAGNPLAVPGTRVIGGRKWLVRCTPNTSTGARVCTDDVWSSVISRVRTNSGTYAYVTLTKWVLNDIVKLTAS